MKLKGLKPFEFGLVNRLVANGQALSSALELAMQLAAFPQNCMRNDRLSMFEQWDLDETAAMKNEIHRGLATMESG